MEGKGRTDRLANVSLSLCWGISVFGLEQLKKLLPGLGLRISQEELHNARDCSGVESSGGHDGGEDVGGDFAVRVPLFKGIDDLLQEIVTVVFTEAHVVEGVAD